MTGEGGREFLTRFLLWTLWQKGHARNSWGADSAVSGVLERRSVYREPPLHTLRVPVALQWHGGNQGLVELGCEPIHVHCMHPVAFSREPLAPYQPTIGNSPCKLTQNANGRCKLNARTFQSSNDTVFQPRVQRSQKTPGSDYSWDSRWQKLVYLRWRNFYCWYLHRPIASLKL